MWGPGFKILGEDLEFLVLGFRGLGGLESRAQGHAALSLGA